MSYCVCDSEGAVRGSLRDKKILNKQVIKQIMALNIKWQRLVDHSETCDRCANTEKELDKAVKKLREALSALDIELNSEKEKLTREEFEKEPTQSNQIMINGEPLEDWLDAKVRTSECCDTCEGEKCRTLKYGGEEYEVVPAELIVNAGLIAAKDINKPAPSSSSGCGCDCC